MGLNGEGIVRYRRTERNREVPPRVLDLLFGAVSRGCATGLRHLKCLGLRARSGFQHLPYAGKASGGTVSARQPGESAESVYERALPYEAGFRSHFDWPEDEPIWNCFETLNIDTHDRGNWPQMLDWLHQHLEIYLGILKQDGPAS